jgi:hypothetical protein
MVSGCDTVSLWEKIILVLDNLNTHSPASLYAAFAPEIALRLANASKSITPPNTVHGLIWLSWKLVMSGNALNRESTIGQTASEVQSWVTEQSNHKAAVHWQFTTSDARIKLQHLYPKF